jgi:hypothetical protein
VCDIRSMRRLLLLWIAIICAKSFGQAIELDARTAKPLPMQLVAAIRKEIGNGCQLPQDNVAFTKAFRSGAFRPGSQHSILVVQATANCLCSPTGNCDFWVFDRVKTEYRELLHAEAVQTFRFLPSSSHGFRDLQTSMHGSAWYSDLTNYRYNGEHYEVHSCLSRDYNDGRGNSLKKPVIASRPCS